MAFNQAQYNKGKTRGLELAFEIYKEKGIEGLKDDISFRLETGINPSARSAYVDECCKAIKLTTLEAVGCMVTNILHDEFDFGKRRCGKFFDKWNEEKQKLSTFEMVDWWKQCEKYKDEKNINIQGEVIYWKKPKYKRTSFEDGKDNAFQNVLKLAESGNEKEIIEMLRFRMKSGSMNFSANNKNCEESMQNAKTLCYEVALVKSIQILNELFGFGEKRYKRFMKRWDLKSNCLMDDLVTWIDLTWVIKEELNLNVDLPYMEEEGWVYHAEG